MPTKVTNENGNIKKGDILVSSKKGFAMKVDENKKMSLGYDYRVSIALMPCKQEECIINVQR